MRAKQIRDVPRGKRVLFSITGVVSGAKVPDLIYVMMHRPELFGRRYGKWLQQLLRGESSWSIGERELFASFTSLQQRCEYCTQTHGAVASLELGEDVVRQVWNDYEHAPISEPVRVALRFIAKMTRSPEDLDADDVIQLRLAGLDDAAIESVIQICAAFNIITRIADALDFDVPPWKQCVRGGKALLKSGYRAPA